MSKQNRQPGGDAPLEAYRRKRRAGATPEPFGGATAGAPGRPLFVVQQHRARALHFDLRLELDGVLKSWAVPKGPSADPADKRFARLVEDHPVEYADFEGRIPEGNYGAGWVIVWDRGTYRAIEDMRDGLRSGKLLFELDGFKLHGRWTLVRMKSAEDWLLIKERDDAARPDGPPFPADSVLSGLTVDELPHQADIARRFASRIARQRAAPLLRRELEPRPMLATAGEAFDRPGWLFELKYDGYRMMARRDGDEVTLFSRTGQPLTQAFPEIAHAVAALPHDRLMLDGEVVVQDDAGRPSFSLLQQRAGLSGSLAVAEAARHQPAMYYVFDLLSAAGRDLRPLPLLTRKKLLREALPSVGPLRYSEHVRGKGRATFESAKRLGLEGIVGKRADGPYRPGRSADWIKVRSNKTADFVVAGWAPSRSNRDDVGALALAEYRAGVLCYVGRVGSGLAAGTRGELKRLFAEAPQGQTLDADAAVQWVAPGLVCEVSFREYTAQGHLRQPVFLRLRPDKAPEECIGHFDAPAVAAGSGSSGATTNSAGTPAGSVGAASRPRSGASPPPDPADVPISNPEKVYFPEKSLSKADLVGYYRRIAPWMLPYLQDRPLVLTRYPDGIHGKRFYQRDAPGFVPDWIERHVLWSESASRDVHYFIVNDVASLVYLANLGTIPIHTWHSRITDLEHPDWCVLDLDPKGAPFRTVVKVALAARDLADEIGMPAFPKTSGASGLHVLLPLGRQLTHDQAKTLGELLARILVARLPEDATITRSVRRREGKVYVDYLQNGHGKLLVAPFSARAEPAASVSMPLRWREVNGRLRNDRFTIANAHKRMNAIGTDPLGDVLHLTPDLHAALEALLALAPSI